VKDAMEAMAMFEKYYTFEQLERRRAEFGDERIRQVEQEGAEKASRGVGSPEYMNAIRAAR
jgi:hypothetical protein